MQAIPDDLHAFLTEHRDSREYRRALAVKLAFQNYPYATICALLDVTPSFISQVKAAYDATGVDGIRLNYQGAQPFLTAEQRHAVIAWLKAGQSWSLEQLRSHIEVYTSKQSWLFRLSRGSH